MEFVVIFAVPSEADEDIMGENPGGGEAKASLTREMDSNLLLLLLLFVAESV